MSPNERGKKPERTIETLKEDNKRFINAGSNIKKAKLFNNAIRPPLFDIPVEQVGKVMYIYTVYNIIMEKGASLYQFT